MNKYKIVEVNPLEHSIVVRFYTDNISEDMLSIQKDNSGKILRGRTDYNMSLPVPAPIGAALVRFISDRAPVEWLETQEDILDPTVNTSMTSIDALVGIEGVVLPKVIA